MQTLLLTLQLLFSVGLVGSVLLHPAKSDGMAGIGAPAKLFGSQKGAESGLNKLTIALALLWAVTSALLSIPGLIK